MSKDIPAAGLFAKNGKEAKVWHSKTSAPDIEVTAAENIEAGEVGTVSGVAQESSADISQEGSENKEGASAVNSVESGLLQAREDEQVEAIRTRNLEAEANHIESVTLLRRAIPNFTDAIRRLSVAIDRRGNIQDLLEDPRRLVFLANSVEEITGSKEISANELERVTGSVNTLLREIGTIRTRMVNTDLESLKGVLRAVRTMKESIRPIAQAVSNDETFTAARANLIRIDLSADRLEEFLHRKLSVLDRYLGGY